jgi:hypothetical protein
MLELALRHIEPLLDLYAKTTDRRDQSTAIQAISVLLLQVYLVNIGANLMLL